MKLIRHFSKLSTRLDYLDGVIGETVASHSLGFQERMVVERSAIMLQNSWELFVRAIVPDSSLGIFSDNSGVIRCQLPTVPKCRREASRILIGAYKKRREEPNWYDPRDAIDAAIKLKLSNEATIAGALGVSPWELDDLRWIRNFIAHSSERSAIKVRGLGKCAPRDKIDVAKLCTTYDQHGAPRYKSWVSFMKVIGRQLI